jgi:hypothetical protein
MFVGIHLLLAKNLGIDELAIEPDEGKQIMTAAQNVMKHYDVQTTQKTLDWIALFFAVGTVYGTRAIVIANKCHKKKAPKEQPAGPTVVPFSLNSHSIIPDGEHA